jgi:hypothetical protein
VICGSSSITKILSGILPACSFSPVPSEDYIIGLGRYDLQS